MDELFSATQVNAQTIQLSSGQRISAFHKASQCEPRNCPVHRPSEHEHRDLPLYFTGTYMVRLTEVRTEENPTGQIIDPDDYEYNRNGRVILRNSAKCHGCNEEIISAFRHDFVTCSCGNVSVDGGGSYIKRSVNDPSNYEDTSISFHKPGFEDKTV